jgi:hypothetical protein
MLGTASAALILPIGISFREHRWRGTCQQVHHQAMRPRPTSQSTRHLLLRACRCDSATVVPASCLGVQWGVLQQRHRRSGDSVRQLPFAPTSTSARVQRAPRLLLHHSQPPAHRSTDRSVWPGTPHPSNPALPALTVAASRDPCSCPLQIPRHSFLPSPSTQNTSHSTIPLLLPHLCTS